MEILNRFITSEIIDDSWNIYNDENANIYYEDKILDIVKNREKPYTYNIKYHKQNKFITCYNGLYYELEHENNENSLYYVFFSSAFVIFVSYIDNYILSDNYKFIKKSDTMDKIFVFYFCDIENNEMSGFISDSDDSEISDKPIDPITFLQNNTGTILFDRQDILEKVIIKKHDIELNTLQIPINVENYTLIKTLEYIIQNWDKLPDLLYIISNPVLIKFITNEEDEIVKNTLISLDETKYAILEENYTIGQHSPISKQYKFKNFWIKELKYNIPSKGLVYYNRDKNYILSRDTIKKNNLDFYKKLYNVRNQISYNILESYLNYSFNYIYKSI